MIRPSGLLPQQHHTYLWCRVRCHYLFRFLAGRVLLLGERQDVKRKGRAVKRPLTGCLSTLVQSLESWPGSMPGLKRVARKFLFVCVFVLIHFDVSHEGCYSIAKTITARRGEEYAIEPTSRKEIYCSLIRRWGLVNHFAGLASASTDVPNETAIPSTRLHINDTSLTSTLLHIDLLTAPVSTLAATYCS